MDDPRPDELLEHCGRLFWRLNAAVAWTDGIGDDTEAKSCSRNGLAAWKRARPLREQAGSEDAAAGYFKERARRRNPVVVASASGWDLVEYDGDQAVLDRKHGLPRLPDSLGWRSRRGPHRAFLAPAGERPVKIQVDESGVTVSTDGYLVTAPAWRRAHGVVYELNGTTELVSLPADLRRTLIMLGDETREQTRRAFEAGEPIPKGNRDLAIFWHAVKLLRDGRGQAETRSRLLEMNREQCRPPLDPQLVEKQFRGAVKFVRTHPTESDRARARARQILEDRRDEGEKADAKKAGISGALIIPMSEFLAASGEEADWLVDHLVARYTMTLLAGLPKVGKSTFAYAAIAAITRVGEFLGLPVRGAGVLLLTEEPPATVEEKVERFGIDESRIYVLPKRRVRGPLKWATIIAEAVRFCEAHPEVEVVVVDTIDKFADIDAKRSESDTGVIRETIEPLYGLLALGVAVVLITHQRKEEGSFGLRVRGGTALTGSADIIVEVERLSAAVNAPAGARVLKIVSRFGDAPNEITVELDGDGWKASGTLKAALRQWRAGRVLELLTEEPATLEEIHERTGGELSRRTLRRRLGELVDDGKAEITGEGVKGSPWRWHMSQATPGFVPTPETASGTNPGKPHEQAQEFVPTGPRPGPGRGGTNPGSPVASGFVPPRPGATPGAAGTNPEEHGR